MRVIPVLDVRNGRAVHAVAGDRAHYGPLRSVLHPGPDPIGLASGVRGILGLAELYVADLGAILDGRPPDFELFRGLAGLGLATCVDAGVRGPADVPPLLDADVSRVIVGLESVAGPDDLAAIIRVGGPGRVAFSLDLRDGRPMIAARATWGTSDPEAIARRACEVGVRTLIRLDLARVGTGRGVGSDPGASPADIERIIGGGVSGPDDLPELAGQGYSAVLIGSAIHDGRIGAKELDGWRE